MLTAQDGTIRTQERALSVAVRHITDLEALLRAAGILVPAIPSMLAPYLSAVP
ncbi:hypothetical protein [Actinacidiphila oryziradicis]|uniref:hypothetical protein n=1 Tax=Actinacidiphila oryziradicis TaxID=2571141 RepID=UPI00145F4572|nr:hypothetical protein [Actinacidiphila oryziradicis]